ncbi:Muskelin N-terminus-domain-containing protein [Epithele typhae]|uniref:Muskelin N-terminus-domain-containing protein n=1 Tax=Epithele typhae TaxID=378194 RepID=UPI002008CEE6|nr:Muskelin N-terminus-domain-containing protein [Epithele typhae]KAH9942390.1 Muskelin N-terminus-domain-containing protein [Epithele typhae]
MSEFLPEPDVQTIEYVIAGASGEHSNGYVPENIILDRPRDQNSRWSGTLVTTPAHNPAPNKQWIRLKLKQTSILKGITFGKFYKSHPCNMKEFKVLVGMHETNMTEILHANLRNDTAAETFSLKSISPVGMPFPTRFVEIVPLTGHGPTFNTSIWHVSLSGITDEAYVERIRMKQQEYRETLTLRQMLKHLRQRRFLTPIAQILSRVGVQLEHTLLTDLHAAFVLRGDWSGSEKLLRDCAAAGLLTRFRHACPAHARWTRIRGLDPDGDVPCRRGGHAMCIDDAARRVYLFGGWDGQRSLDDFWAYDVAADSWRLLSLATSREPGGPSPRACHKMVFDDATGAIYLLGRLGDADPGETHRPRGASGAHAGTGGGPPQAAPPTDAETARNRAAAMASTAAPFGGAWPSHCSEFFRYQTRGPDAGKWERLTNDTAASGGPPLVYDHQMCIDSEKQIIYVSGGRVVGEHEALRFSGIYSYDIRASRWKMYNISDTYAAHPYIVPRWGHSMVFDPTFQTLFIFAGQRDENYLADMYAFHIPTNTVTELFANFSLAGGPLPCFTQRAVIDPSKREIYVLCGLTRRNGTAHPELEAEGSYWIYRYERPELPGRWSKILPRGDKEKEKEKKTEEGEGETPQPRYAHQVVYDATSGSVLMHGGNAGVGRDADEKVEEPAARTDGEAGAPAAAEGGEHRLDDFWHLEIVRPSDEEIVRRAVYEVRQQQFREMCEDGPPIKALTFIQTRVSSVVNHSDPEEARTFRALFSTHLLAAPSRMLPSAASGAPSSSSRVATPTPATIALPSAAGAPQRADTPPPRKRSRPNTPEPDRERGSVIKWDTDPAELEEAGASPPSPERYRQRTQMFERLLAFVNEDAKEPGTDLVDMLATDGFVI